MQEQDIPIDIHTNKLLDWMLSRKICARDWQQSVLTIRAKINNAIQDMPVHKGITKLVSGSYINYFHCKKIIGILKETELSSKNIFGSYGSQRMKDWLEIVRLYEKDNVYLAEAAQMLIRNVNYEVPGLKKEILHAESLLIECRKKEESRLKTINVAHNDFETLRKSLGIQGKNIRKELLSRTRELPDIYALVAKSTKSLDKCVDFYTEYATFTLGKTPPGGCVPILKYIIGKGNTSIYEWTTGKVPIPRTNVDPLKDEEDLDEGEHDSDADEIDFDEIDFDLDITVVIEGDVIDFGEDNNVIDLTHDPVKESCSEEQYASLLDSATTRDTFIDELRELEAFLRTRLYEMRSTSDILTLTQMQDAPTIVQLQTTETVQKMMDNVQTVLSKITDPITHHLHNIKYSPRYVDNLTNTLKQKLNMIEKMEATKSTLEAKRVETVAQIKNAEPKVKLIIEKTRELQAEIEEDISKKYKNRPVNIMGGVNVL